MDLQEATHLIRTCTRSDVSSLLYRFSGIEVQKATSDERVAALLSLDALIEKFANIALDVANGLVWAEWSDGSFRPYLNASHVEQIENEIKKSDSKLLARTEDFGRRKMLLESYVVPRLLLRLYGGLTKTDDLKDIIGLLLAGDQTVPFAEMYIAYKLNEDYRRRRATSQSAIARWYASVDGTQYIYDAWSMNDLTPYEALYDQAAAAWKVQFAAAVYGHGKDAMRSKVLVAIAERTQRVVDLDTVPETRDVQLVDYLWRAAEDAQRREAAD